MTALWWLAAWVAGSFVLVGVWCAGHAYGEAKATRDWHAMHKQLGVEHGKRLQRFEDYCDDLEVQLAKADATIRQLNKNIGVVYDAGVMAGQTLQADRQEHDL